MTKKRSAGRGRGGGLGGFCGQRPALSKLKDDEECHAYPVVDDADDDTNCYYTDGNGIPVTIHPPAHLAAPPAKQIPRGLYGGDTTTPTTITTNASSLTFSHKEEEEEDDDLSNDCQFLEHYNTGSGFARHCSGDVVDRDRDRAATAAAIAEKMRMMSQKESIKHQQLLQQLKKKWRRRRWKRNRDRGNSCSIAAPAVSCAAGGRDDDDDDEGCLTFDLFPELDEALRWGACLEDRRASSHRYRDGGDYGDYDYCDSDDDLLDDDDSCSSETESNSNSITDYDGSYPQRLV